MVLNLSRKGSKLSMLGCAAPPRMVREPPRAPKRRRRLDSHVVFVAVCALRAGELEQRQWQIVGLAEFTAAQHFQSPTNLELKHMEAIHRVRCPPTEKYDFPVAGVVRACGYFDEALPVLLPPYKHVVKLPENVVDRVANSSLAGLGATARRL